MRVPTEAFLCPSHHVCWGVGQITYFVSRSPDLEVLVPHSCTWKLLQEPHFASGPKAGHKTLGFQLHWIWFWESRGEPKRSLREGAMERSHGQRVNYDGLIITTQFLPLLPLSGKTVFSSPRMWAGLGNLLRTKECYGGHVLPNCRPSLLRDWQRLCSLS